MVTWVPALRRLKSGDELRGLQDGFAVTPESAAHQPARCPPHLGHEPTHGVMSMAIRLQRLYRRGLRTSS